MPVTPTYPGVYIQEVPSGVRTITGVSTSIALFIGTTQSGPIFDPIRCTTYTDFVRAFSDDTSTAQLPNYLKLFFLKTVTIDMQPRRCIFYELGWPAVKRSIWILATDRVFKALADTGRRRLLDNLRIKGGQTLNMLCEGMPMSRQAVTKHLTQLEEADLIVTVWNGLEKLQYLNPLPIYEMAKRLIRPFESHRLESLSDLKKRLED